MPMRPCRSSGRNRGRPIDAESLAQERYVGSSRGSTAEELRQAVEDHGAHATIRDGLTVGGLRFSDDPILLHLHEPGQDAAYDHWVLFMGCVGDRARIIDRTDEVTLVPLAELLALWDCKGVVISRESSYATEYASWLDAGLVVFFGMMFLISSRLIFARIGRPGCRPLTQVAAQATAVLIFSCGLAVIWHAIRSEGFFGNRTAVGLTAEHRLPIETPLLCIDELVALRDCNGCTLVDCRLPRDYRGGHIPGAVSIPITAGWVERRELIGFLPVSDKTVVVYCQSEKCEWSDIIARAIIAQGHSRVAIFRGGFQEWARHGRSTETAN